MNTITRHIIVSAEYHQARLDVVLSRSLPEYSRSQLQQWIKEGNVTVNDQVIQKTRHTVQADDSMVINITPTEQITAKAEAIPLLIIDEDEYLLVVNKPVGLIVHPGAGNPDHTLVNALLYHAPQLSHLPRAGIVHRLDKDTSGLLVVAKTIEMHNALIKLMQARKIKREYRALVCGKVISGGTIDAPMGRHKTQRTKMAVVNDGRSAITHYRVLKPFSCHTLLSVQLETGRTHQIRVHMAHLGYPIVGDRVYARQRIYPSLTVEAKEALDAFDHQALHAFELSLTHPVTRDVMTWQAPLPKDFEELLKVLAE